MNTVKTKCCTRGCNCMVNVAVLQWQSVLMLLWAYDSFKRLVFWKKKCSFLCSVTVKQNGRKWELCFQMAHGCPSSFDGLHRSCNRRKIGNVASAKVCKIPYAPASIRSDTWKHVGFPVSRNEKGKTEDNMHTLPDYTDTHLRHWFSHIVHKFSCCLLNASCTIKKIK